MAMGKLSLLKTVFLTLAGSTLLFVALNNPSHWRESSSRSCQLCGNRQVVIRHFRWWQLDRERVEPVVGAEFPVPEGHTHDWWQYAATFSSYGLSWGSDKTQRYRDGGMHWTPAEN